MFDGFHAPAGNTIMLLFIGYAYLFFNPLK